MEQRREAWQGMAGLGKAGQGAAWQGYTHSILNGGAEAWLKNQPRKNN
jgi:hypothetical protein